MHNLGTAQLVQQQQEIDVNRPVYCSQCGQQKGLGLDGFSACHEHAQFDAGVAYERQRAAEEREARAIAADLAYNKAKNSGALDRRTEYLRHLEEINSAYGGPEAKKEEWVL